MERMGRKEQKERTERRIPINQQPHTVKEYTITEGPAVNIAVEPNVTVITVGKLTVTIRERNVPSKEAMDAYTKELNRIISEAIV